MLKVEDGDYRLRMGGWKSNVGGFCLEVDGLRLRLQTDG